MRTRRSLVVVYTNQRAQGEPVRHMSNATNEVIPGPGSTPKDILSEVSGEGAQQMLAKAIRDEAAAYVEEHADERDEYGHRLVARNGYKKQRAIESIFATVRLRHRRTKGSGSRSACFAMIFKLVQSASKRWRRLTGHALITDVIHGVQFKDGIRQNVA